MLHCRERGREVRSTLEDFGHGDQLNLEFCSSWNEKMLIVIE